MRHNLHKALLFLCLGTMLTGIVAAQDQGGETYSAYPGTPTPAPYTPVPTPTPGTTTVQSTGQIVSAYQTTTSPFPAPQPDVTTATTLTGTVTAINYQAPPPTQKNILLTYNVQTAPPAAVFYSGTFVPWTSFYQVVSANSPALWIATSAGWSWNANCPLGGWVQELMYIPATGTMKLYDLYPDGTTKYYSYGWATQGYKYRWLNVDMQGRYMTMLTVSDNPSNYITIDVV